MIRRALDSTAQFENENKHIRHAEKKLAKALDDKNWIDEVHAELKKGQKIYSDTASAVAEYEKALKDHAKGKKATLSNEALAAIDAAPTDIETAIVILTETRMDETSGLTALDPKKQKKVDSETDKSLKEYEDGMDKIAIGDLDKGIRELVKAWTGANQAERHALDEPKVKKGR